MDIAVTPDYMSFWADWLVAGATGLVVIVGWLAAYAGQAYAARRQTAATAPPPAAGAPQAAGAPLSTTGS